MTIATTKSHIHHGVFCPVDLRRLVLARAGVATGAVAAPASMAQSSASPRMFPPTKRMYEKETIITMMNVSTAIADPRP